MKNKINKAKKIIFVDAIILILIIGGLFLLTPKIIGTISKDRLTFFKFTNAYAILIDDNPDFSSPKEVTEEAMKLNPGQYYWKAIGVLGESEMGNFSIDSEVIVNMRIDRENITIHNKGNVPINVEESAGQIIFGNMIIDINEKEEFENKLNATFEVSQND